MGLYEFKIKGGPTAGLVGGRQSQLAYRHSERSEESRGASQILRCAQNDRIHDNIFLS
jgi:hypothetical protein